MRRFATAITLAILALALTASVTMAAPRINPKGTITDIGLCIGWDIGGAIDYNAPLSKTMSLRISADGGFGWWYGGFDVNASAGFIFPVWNYENFSLALQAGPQVGYSWDGFYVGALIGLAAQYKLNNEWTFIGESAYGPGVGFYVGGPGYHSTGRYGFYAIYTMDKNTTLIFGERSVDFNPNFYIGLVF